MCGIAGIINYKNNKTSQSILIKKMADRIKHRGPDDEGYVLFSDNKAFLYHGNDTPYMIENSNEIDNPNIPSSHIAFGHRRLSIIDLSASGHQPMSYNNRYWIVFNGEIFNYIELKEELTKNGYIFHTQSDTEVILASYDYWKDDCFNRFNGMWSFVIYDLEKGKIIISRDRFAIKPLYYYQDANQFVFASEIKSLLVCPFVKTKPNLKYIKTYIKHGPQEHIAQTVFEGIYRFPFSHYFIGSVESLKKITAAVTRYWNPQVNLKNTYFNEEKCKEYAKKYYDLLKDSVRLRLRADVKIGAALSGGLDSSSITYLINHVLRETGNESKQETFSSVYQSKGTETCDESEFINELALFLNVNTNQIEPVLEDIPDEIHKVVCAFENPQGGPNMGGWYTFKRIYQSPVIINLDGQGADEQLGGYFKYIWRYIIHLKWRELQKEYHHFKNLPNMNQKKLLFCVFMNIILKLLPVKILKKILGFLGLNRIKKWFHTVNEELNDDTYINLVRLLHYGDRQSMAHSIESRVPFMDYRLVEFLAKIPAVYKMRHGWTKYIARRAFDKLLPDNITWRKDKMGWPDPIDYWFKGPLKEWMCEEIEKSPLIKKLGHNKNIYKKAGKTKTIAYYIRLLNLSLWYKIFFIDQKLIDFYGQHSKNYMKKHTVL